MTALRSVEALFGVFSHAVLQTRKLHKRGGPAQKDVVWEERCAARTGAACQRLGPLAFPPSLCARVENANAAFDALVSMRPRVQRAAMKSGLVGRGAGELRRRLEAFFVEADA